jgi:hypothetical protein
MDDHQRRSEDRDRELNHRLDQLEKAYSTLTATVTQLETSVNVVKLEQSHLKEIFDSRMRILEKGQELQLTKIDQVSRDIQLMGSDAEKTPAGRSMIGNLHTVQASCDELGEKVAIHKEWMDRVDGVLTILKWVGAGGLVALGISILRLLKMLP